MIGVLRTGFYDLSMTFFTQQIAHYSLHFTPSILLQWLFSGTLYYHPRIIASSVFVRAVTFETFQPGTFFCARRSTFKIAGSGMSTRVLFQSQDKKVKCVIFIILLLHVCIPLKFVQKVKVIPKLRSLNGKVMSRLNCKKNIYQFQKVW